MSLCFDSTGYYTMSITPSIIPFVAVISLALISDYGLQATKNAHGKGTQRRGYKYDRSAAVLTSSCTARRHRLNSSDWTTDSVIQFEINEEHLCVGTLLDESGTDVPTITTVVGTLHASIFAPGQCLAKIKENLHEVKAKTAQGEDVRFELGDDGSVNLVDTTKLNPMPLAKKKLSKGTKGMSAIYNNGKVVLKQFVIVGKHECSPQHQASGDYYFCAENVDDEQINAGIGSPFFIKLASRQVAVGVQIGYDEDTGRNTYFAPKIEPLVSLPEKEMETTSGGTFESYSVIKIEQKGQHLCLGSVIETPVAECSTLFIPHPCIEKMKESIQDVTFKTAKGAVVPVELSVENDKITFREMDYSKVSDVMRAKLNMPVGVKGMAAIWEKNKKVAWRQFTVTDIANCDLPSDHKYSNDVFCAKHVGNKKVDAGSGSSFFIKVRGTQYLVGIQTEYSSRSGGNLYYQGKDNEQSLAELNQFIEERKNATAP